LGIWDCCKHHIWVIKQFPTFSGSSNAEALPASDLKAEGGEAQLERLHKQLAVLQNQIGFKELRKAPDAEVAPLRDQLTRVQSRINEIEGLILSQELVIPVGEDKYKTYVSSNNNGYARGGQLAPLSDLTKQDNSLDFGGNYRGRWHASKDYLHGDGDGA
jgi:hypothetical protein